MGYFASFAVDDSGRPVDSDEVASNTGWAAFQGWADDLDSSYPELGYLCEHGEAFPADALAQLEADLERALEEKPGDPPPDVLSVARRLLGVVRGRPEGAVAVVVTDGTGG